MRCPKWQAFYTYIYTLEKKNVQHNIITCLSLRANQSLPLLPSRRRRFVVSVCVRCLSRSVENRFTLNATTEQTDRHNTHAKREAAAAATLATLKPTSPQRADYEHDSSICGPEIANTHRFHWVHSCSPFASA